MPRCRLTTTKASVHAGGGGGLPKLRAASSPTFNVLLILAAAQAITCVAPLDCSRSPDGNGEGKIERTIKDESIRRGKRSANPDDVLGSFSSFYSSKREMPSSFSSFYHNGGSGKRSAEGTAPQTFSSFYGKRSDVPSTFSSFYKRNPNLSTFSSFIKKRSGADNGNLPESFSGFYGKRAEDDIPSSFSSFYGKRSGDLPASFSSFYKRGGDGGDKEEVLVPFSSFYGKRSSNNGVPQSFSSFYKREPTALLKSFSTFANGKRSAASTPEDIPEQFSSFYQQ